MSRQRLADRLDAPVAGGVAVGVVDALEVVDVEHQQQRRLAGARHAVDLARQRQLELAAVRQAGQRIAAGQVAQARRSRACSQAALPGRAGRQRVARLREQLQGRVQPQRAAQASAGQRVELCTVRRESRGCAV